MEELLKYQKKWEELLLYMNMKKENSENKNT